MRARPVALVLLALAASCTSSDPQGGVPTDASALDTEPPWQTLFNGVDFTGWDRYLGKPSDTAPLLGLENDPLGVFSVVMIDQEPAIHISGQVWGALISKAEYGNFHLRAQYKWGTKSWPPLNFLDSGIMYLSTGPLGAVNAGGDALSSPAGTGAFMVSIEFQISPGDLGRVINLGPISLQPGTRTVMPDLPSAWNQVEIIFQGGSAVHLLNGQQVASASGFTLNWPGMMSTSLDHGKLQLQSEGGEIYFRHVEIQSLP